MKTFYASYNAADARPVAMISYWPTPGCDGSIIRHTSHADAAYLASAQISGRNGNMPSASVWLVPGTEA